MKYHIITIFPEIFSSYFSHSIIARAQKNKLIDIQVHDLRKWATDKHKTVDDTPYGGGAGMILKVEPLYKALKELAPRKKKSRKIILTSAKGKTFNQSLAKSYAKNLKEIIIICGRYEGVDERIKEFIDEELSIGNYVLTGGEIPAMAIIDASMRLLPEVLGNKESIVDESHNKPGLLEYPQYSKPQYFKTKKKTLPVPDVLLSGNHQKIKKWRQKHQNKQ
ncbi:MAG TPA: tRNA (guanosine(37)-N1)-methyltransferase TrmD [Patescibacteria group bacterium]|nr:tRNA (guanosine(37)-N1)-methyltransferase TrmD [Patescibacteria group bacterium]